MTSYCCTSKGDVAKCTFCVHEDVQGSNAIPSKHAMRWIAALFSSEASDCMMEKAVNVQIAVDLFFSPIRALIPFVEEGWHPTMEREVHSSVSSPS
jgi:hypothetical protein